MVAFLHISLICLICLSRIYQTGRCAWFFCAGFVLLDLPEQAQTIQLKQIQYTFSAWSILIRKSGKPTQPDQSCSGITGKLPSLINLALPDWSVGCQIKSRQMPDWSGPGFWEVYKQLLYYSHILQNEKKKKMGKRKKYFFNKTTYFHGKYFFWFLKILH